MERWRVVAGRGGRHGRSMRRAVSSRFSGFAKVWQKRAFFAKAWQTGLAAAGLLLAGAGGCGPAAGGAGEGGGEARVAAVSRGDVVRVAVMQGEVTARHVERIAAGVQGPAVLAELAEEGTRVEAGDVVARFESAQLEQDLARQEGEAVRAAQELSALEKAELPLEVLELEGKLKEAEEALEGEKAFAGALRELAGRGLAGEGEVAQQEAVAAAAETRVRQLEERAALTKGHLHAARLAKARAALEAAERQRDFTRRQLEACTVRAPVAGRVSLPPVSIGGEFRTARVGDALFRNQVFLCLPEEGEYVLRGDVGEGDLPGIAEGARARVAVAAFPDLELEGRVERVGALAQSRPGEAAWKKAFPVVVALEGVPEGFPVGLSARAEIEAGAARGVLKVPRAALSWGGDGRAEASVRGKDGGVRRVAVDTGLAGTMECEVRGGLAEGDEVLLP